MKDYERKTFIFGAIFALANHLQVIGDAFDKNITIKQWLFLASVSKFPEPPTISEAADFIGYSRQNAKRIAAILEEHGFLKINKDPNDARNLRLSLTPKCNEYFANRETREEEFIRKLFAGFDDELTNGLYNGINMLFKNIEMMGIEHEDSQE